LFEIIKNIVIFENSNLKIFNIIGEIMSKVSLTSQSNLRNTFSFALPNILIYTSDGIVSDGGIGEFPSPIDWLMSGLGNCILTTMAMVAARNNANFVGTTMTIERTFTEPPRKRIATIEINIIFPEKYNDAIFTKLKNAANACPAKNSLHSDIQFTINFDFKK
jgi:uncharacterized OsmC-like protein